MSNYPRNPYIDELKNVMTSPTLKREYTIALLHKRGWMFANDCRLTRSHKGVRSYHYSIGCCFGELQHRKVNNRNGCIDKPYPEGYTLYNNEQDLVVEVKDEIYRIRRENPWYLVLEKNGIEILGAQPNATGHTYSNKCQITIKELKEACKMNNIKTTKMNKKDMLHALMKI